MILALLSPVELALILGIILLMGLECWSAIRSRSWVQVYRPTLFVSVVLAFYVLVGPLRAILSVGEVANFVGTSGTTFRGLDHRSLLIWGWLGALVFYASLLSGFYLFQPVCLPHRLMLKADLAKIRRWGSLLCWAGVAMYSLSNGGRILFLLNPFNPGQFNQSVFGFSGFNLGVLTNYFNLAINLLIPGIVIQFAVWLRQRKGMLEIFLWLVLAILLYLSEAFRYRILLLVIPIMLLWLFYNRRRPMLVLLLVFMVGFVSLNGLIGYARTQVRGLDVQKLAVASPLEVIISSFEEAGAFFTTSAVIHAVPAEHPFIGFEPLVTAALQPLPRKYFSWKPSGEYPSKLPDQIYSETWGGYKTHAAFLSYAEYYLMFGWYSLVTIGIISGVVLRRLWKWFLWRQYEPLAQSIYLLNASFIYVLVSRGYFAQTLTLYCFTVIPTFFVYLKLSHRS